LLHVIASLKSTGKGAIILPHGVLFRGNAESEIRKKIIHKGYIKGMIGLPANPFYGTGIPACIVVLDKKNPHARTGIFMIDASKGFVKDGNKNRLRSEDIHKIVDAFSCPIPATVPVMRARRSSRRASSPPSSIIPSSRSSRRRPRTCSPDGVTRIWRGSKALLSATSRSS
jgi:hypothetical protein